MSVRIIHGAPGAPDRAFADPVYKGMPLYRKDQRQTQSLRAKSSSSNANNEDNAWNVNFNNGNVNNNNKTNTNHARCVRGGTWTALCPVDRRAQ